jgi:hypothetical protein
MIFTDLIQGTVEEAERFACMAYCTVSVSANGSPKTP